MSLKPLRIAVVMDPIEDIKPRKDTTLAMLLAAQRRGWELHYLELPGIWLRDGVALGRGELAELLDRPMGWRVLEACPVDSSMSQGAGRSTSSSTTPILPTESMRP